VVTDRCNARADDARAKAAAAVAVAIASAAGAVAAAAAAAARASPTVRAAPTADMYGRLLGAFKASGRIGPGAAEAASQAADYLVRRRLSPHTPAPPDEAAAEPAPSKEGSYLSWIGGSEAGESEDEDEDEAARVADAAAEVRH
jgi:hypothetical protein